MLSLLPPLMVIQPKWYHEEVQDTLNSTWEEGSCKPLIYYRPVLVLGNKLQVFEKGYVGNTTGKPFQISNIIIIDVFSLRSCC